ncbi:FH2 domain-containing protein 1-like [Plectropomus leopardus]|uniref:FH2 domain-containing protein 1-like n=1 Tax=Plectropomus leopardus TaxID=160734 RepID=UPI001C4ACFEA|nr:FH2 domain-containing protein 1-like [Plectropomus leopardus]
MTVTLSQVAGAFGLRCSSETDMSSAVSRHDGAGLLMELLTPKCRPRSPLNNSNSPLGRSGSLRRSRHSPSSSPSIAADRELSTLLGMVTPEHKEARTAFLSPELKSPGLSPQTLRVPTRSFPQNQQPHAASTPSLSAQNHTTATYLSDDATHTRVNATSKVKTTSDSNQQPNNSKDRTLSDLQSGSRKELARTNKADLEFSGRSAGVDEEPERSATGNMSVVLEKCTLVPELKVFDEVGHKYTSRLHERDDVVITDLEDEERSESRREEEDGREDTVVVWCVTGVCEVAEDLADNAQTQQNQSGSDNQVAVSAPANRTPSEPQPANEKPVPVPISSQPVPVSRCNDPSPVSSSRWRPAEPASPPGASEEAGDHLDEAEGSTNEKRDVEVVQELSNDRSRNEVTSCQTTNENTTSSTNRKPESSSKLSAKNVPTSKSRPAATKPGGDKSKPIRTLTSSENQGMRRVVPISRPSRGAPSLGKRSEKPPGLQRGSSSTAATNASNLNTASVRRGERPSTAPSSRRSSIQKQPDLKEVSGTPNQDLQRKPSIRKPLTKPKPPPEEKMCRSTLRALALGGSVSAPVTPSHKAATPLPLPGFARSTASSSFRRTALAPAAPSPRTASDSPKTSSSVATSFTRTGSLRVSATSRSSDLHSPSSSSTLRRTQSIRAPPRSPLHDPQAPPKGHKRNDSGTFSDKSTHSRDSGKSSRPSWR